MTEFYWDRVDPDVAPIPLALVVDDDPGQRRAKTTFLEAMAFRVITAESLVDAWRELSASPLVDVLITDVNLVASDGGDTSGVALARGVKSRHPNLPVFGYSAHFEPGSIGEELRKAFDGILLKGFEGRGELRSAAEHWRQSALKHRAKRVAATEAQLQQLTVKYGLSKHDVWLLREFMPAARENPSPEHTSIEQVLSAAGYRFRIVCGGEIELRDAPSSSTMASPSGQPATVVSPSKPIPVWLRDTPQGVEAEVYGFPELYGSGKDETESIKDLVLLMEGFHREFSAAPEQNASPHLQRLRDYLSHVMT